MLEQTFTVGDIPRILVLAFLEILLSADNAIVLGLIVRHLSPKKRKKALVIGVISGILLRAAAIFLIIFLLNKIWFEIIGGIYLLYLCAHHFMRSKKTDPLLPSPRQFWKTVLLIELIDFCFALDSIVAGLAFIAPFRVSNELNPKLWIIFIGGIIGILSIRYAADFFAKIIDRFPLMEKTAFLLIGWIGVNLGVDAVFTTLSKEELLKTPLANIIFWGVIVLLIGSGFIFSMKRKKDGKEKVSK